jgi:hypothetical protein
MTQRRFPPPSVEQLDTARGFRLILGEQLKPACWIQHHGDVVVGPTRQRDRGTTRVARYVDHALNIRDARLKITEAKDSGERQCPMKEAL